MNKISIYKNMIGYLYIRQHSSWDIYKCYKIGITESIINRESTYKTSEIECGSLIKVFKIQNITKLKLDNIDKLIKKELEEFNYQKNAGTEFYKYDSIKNIENIFINNNIEYIELTNDEINDLTRKIYNNNSISGIPSVINISSQFLIREYQEDIITKCKDFFIKHNKGLLVLPCGVGKTLISLFFIEYLQCNKIIIGVPNILLLNQWYNIIKTSINKNCQILQVYNNITIEEIFEFINSYSNYIIITTYSSSYKLYKASNNYKFDILINDEVHHLTSINNKEFKKEYVNILKLNVSKQLSLTATIKILDKNYNIENSNSIISNDNIEYFGNIIENKSLLWAINKNIVCDYEIQTIITKEKNIIELLDELNITSYEDKCLFTSAYASLLSINKGTSHHLLIYCNKIENSITINNYIKSLLEYKFHFNNIYYSEFHGNLKKEQQKSIIKNFEQSTYGIISCVYCLGEGWDLPLLDGVVFAENMYSNIRIVQSALRGCRKNINEPNKINKIILPILNSNSNDNYDKLFNSDEFVKVKEIILKLGLEDESIYSKFKIYNLNNVSIKSNRTISKHESIYKYNDDITKQFILKSIPRSQFTISYEKAKQIVKKHKIQSLEDYYKLCEIDNRLSVYPRELYNKNNWINWIDYLSIDTSKYYDYKTCKKKIKEYCLNKVIKLNTLDISKACKDLYKIDKNFPSPGLWSDYYKLKNLDSLFINRKKRFS